MNQSSLLLRGMAIIAISVLLVSAGMIYTGMLYTDPNFAAKWYPYEMSLALVAVLLWYILLRKDIPLNFGINFNRTFFITLPILLLTIGIFIWTLYASETLDGTKMAMYLATGISVGIAEEMIFRVAGYRVLVASGNSVKKAILISAVLFSLFHLTNLFSGVGVLIVVQLINTFMIGVVFAYIYYKTESILYVMLLHFIWDFSAFNASAFLEPEQNPTIILFLMSIIYFVWAITNVLKLKK